MLKAHVVHTADMDVHLIARVVLQDVLMLLHQVDTAGIVRVTMGKLPHPAQAIAEVRQQEILATMTMYVNQMMVRLDTAKTVTTTATTIIYANSQKIVGAAQVTAVAQEEAEVTMYIAKTAPHKTPVLHNQIVLGIQTLQLRTATMTVVEDIHPALQPLSRSWEMVAMICIQILMDRHSTVMAQ